MTTALLMQLITVTALIEGIPPETALAIAKLESNFNMKAVGPKKEIGAMQVLPSSSKFTVQQLQDPIINIKEGMRILKLAKTNCKHQKDNTWVNCYNLGVAGGNKLKHPHLFKYYKKYVQTKEELRSKIRAISKKKMVAYAKN
jgi:hypothetical protein